LVKAGILLESLLEGYAEFFSVELGEKAVRGMTENALKNKYNGGNIPMGYIIDSEQHFQIDPIAAPVIIEIFTLYANGSSVKEIINKLTRRIYYCICSIKKVSRKQIKRYFGCLRKLQNIKKFGGLLCNLKYATQPLNLVFLTRNPQRGILSRCGTIV